MMKFLALFLLLNASLAEVYSQTPLRIGDVLLQPLKCWACTLIEEEEETIYSHIGVVLRTSPEVIVGESFGKVRAVTLREFDSKTERGQQLKVLRFRNAKLRQIFQDQSSHFWNLFKSEFENLSYDHDFRWNNIDANGNEKYYCSELVSKLFLAFVGLETPIKRMHFQKNRDQWLTYFKGEIPDHQWGNSPGDFERSELFYAVGEL